MLRSVLSFTLLAGVALVPSPALGGDATDFDSLWNYEDPAGTEAAFRQLLPSFEAEKDLDRVLQLKTQIARTLGLQRRFEELGEGLLLLGQEHEARPHFAAAWKGLSGDPWLAEHQPDRLARLKERAGR